MRATPPSPSSPRQPGRNSVNRTRLRKRDKIYLCLSVSARAFDNPSCTRGYSKPGRTRKRLVRKCKRSTHWRRFQSQRVSFDSHAAEKKIEQPYIRREVSPRSSKNTQHKDSDYLECPNLPQTWIFCPATNTNDIRPRAFFTRRKH